MNARLTSSYPLRKSLSGAPAPAKEPTEASIGQFVSGGAPTSFKSKDDAVGDDRKCSYKDYSHIAPPPKTTNKASSSSWKALEKEPPFPVKLHRILSSPQFRHIITWLPHGRSFKVLDQQAFEEQVIPLFFKTGRYASFCRQLNGWGFRRMNKDNSYYHELFLRGMPHLAEKMKRVKAKDDQREERPPDLDAISRVKPLPRDPSPPPSITSSNLDSFLANLTDEEAHFLARRRAQMLERAAQIASTQRNVPALPTNSRDMNAYLARLSDEEALVLARRREQELQAIQERLRRLRQQPRQPLRRAAPRAQQAPSSSTTRVAFQNELGLGASTTTLTGEEKLLLATHRARKLTCSAMAKQNALAQERTRWEKMKHDFNMSAQTTQGLSQMSNSIVESQTQGVGNVAMHSNPLLAALLARPSSRDSSSAGRQRSNSQSSDQSPGNPLVAALLARHAGNRRPQGTNSQESKLESTLGTNARLQQKGNTFPIDLRPQSGRSEPEPSIEERVRQAKVQADFLNSAIRNDARRASAETASTVSSDTEAAIISRARQVQLQSEILDPTPPPQVRRDSISVVKEALDTMRRGESMFGASSRPMQSQQQQQQQQQNEQCNPASSAHENIQRSTELENLSQRNTALNESRTSISHIRESLLKSSELDVAKFLVKYKENGS